MQLKNLDKIYSKEGNVTKGQTVEYYQQFGELVLPHIKNKPFCMIHFPDGVGGKSFYQKQAPANIPNCMDTVTLPSSRRGTIDWCMVNNVDSMIYMASRSVIEMHTFFSRIDNLHSPDVAVIDLDPSGKSGFNEARLAAIAFGTLLAELKLKAVPKTSGGSGIHIYIPIVPTPYAEVVEFLGKLCDIVCNAMPNLATTKRLISTRGDKVYLDYIQNSYSKTIVAPYSLRMRAGIPVATPLLWEELDDKNLSPQTFNINNIAKRIDKVGDLMKNFYKTKQTLPQI